MGKFTLLHTSDWHLGHKLYSRSREEEFKKFIDWLAALIRERGVNAVIIAGDVFHTSLPDTGAQKLYYDFLRKAAQAGARHIIVTAGNHDSPAFLTAPKDFLANFNVFVTGTVGNNIDDEILVLRDSGGNAEAVICAIPFLREKDIRSAVFGEDNRDKEEAYKEAITGYYRRLAQFVREKYSETDIPIIVTGHLYTANSSVSKSMERLYAGGQGAVEADMFEDIFDYAALGHIHRPMKIGKLETRRYAGSPIPLHFDETGYTKSIVLADFDGHKVKTEICAVPVFQRLMALNGSRKSLLEQVRKLYKPSENPEEGIWFELNHDGSDSFTNLEEEAAALINEPYAILHCNPAPYKGRFGIKNMERNLQDFKPEDIFALCLDQKGYEGENRKKMTEAFEELLVLYNNRKREGN